MQQERILTNSTYFQLYNNDKSYIITTMACNKNHSAIQGIMAKLPIDQGGKGRHKCAACAYEQGYNLGRQMSEQFDIGQIIDGLDESQAQNQRHKSPHAAFALGYYNGVKDAYQ